MRFWFQIPGKGIECFEGKLEDPLKVAHGFNGGVDRHRAAHMRKSPKIVEAHDVIGMRMSKDYCIDSADIFPQSLRPEIGPSVHDPRTFGRLDIN